MAAWEPDDLTLLEALHARLRETRGRGQRASASRLPCRLRQGPIAHAFDDAISPVADELERRWASLLDPPEIAWCPAREERGPGRG